MFRNVLLGSLLSLVVLQVAGAETKTIVLTNGKTYTGDVRKTATGYVVKLDFSEVTFTFDQVKEVRDVADKPGAGGDDAGDKPASGGDFNDRYARVDKTDPEALYDLASWAFYQKKLYAQTKALAEKALQLKPDHRKARLLLRMAESKLKSTTTKTPGTGEKIEPGELAKMLLSEEDVYRVRRAELRLWFDRRRGPMGDDRRVSVQFRNDVLQRFIEKMSGRGDFKQPRFREKFLSWSMPSKAAYILTESRKEDHSIRDDILIRTDPKFMRDFRLQVWPIIRTSCGSTQCHGNPTKANGGMKLFETTGRSEQADYTNFVVLSGFRTKSGLRLLDRGESEKSILLEFGLPRDQAKHHHPKKIQPVFRSARDLKYRRVLAWIKQLKGPLHPDYRLSYKPPFGMKLHTSGEAVLPPTEPAGPADSGKTKPSGGDPDSPFK